MNPNSLRSQLLQLARSHVWTWDQKLLNLLEQQTTGASAPITDVHPVVSLRSLGKDRLAALAADHNFTTALADRKAEVDAYLAASVDSPQVAYFSPEFGISDRIPQYSGGLGILAGDHLKACSDLKVPLCGVGLLYRQGFFRQSIEAGRQAERYETHTARDLGLTDANLKVSIPIADREIQAKVWTLTVGRVQLALLDTSVTPNTRRDRAITDRLYSGDRRHRLEQEMVLGVGGARAVAALGWDPPLYHLNEGHAGFLIFELIDREVQAGATMTEALERIEPRLLFTTHTPVPAGIDRFERSLIDDYLQPWAERWKVTVEAVARLGHDPAGGDDEFNMAILCLKAAAKANGVSKLHGAVSRKLFGHVPKGLAIGSITNGVHARTWTDPVIQEAFDEIGGPGWAEGDTGAWKRIAAMEAAAIRNLRLRGGETLTRMVAEQTGVELDPTALTIGFARRFATYKRADLLLRHQELLEQLLADDTRPVQFVFAGKAHPADVPGQELLAKIVEFAQSEGANNRFVFVADYNIAVAAAMYAGCDVWLNNPVRPREASGTSGEKAALNGSLNCSISDGWWDEMATDTNGWTIPASRAKDTGRRDLEESRAALRILSKEIVPDYWGDGEPWSAAWIERIRSCWETLGPKVTAARMITDYRDVYYQPMLDALQQ
ncbi:MAG: alpha-glucan family phosphorylase [Acidimicrobiia bacterium]|nr:alpha-glucan family phosphorylase [Acidimicrobiia bacterium]